MRGEVSAGPRVLERQVHPNSGPSIALEPASDVELVLLISAHQRSLRCIQDVGALEVNLRMLVHLVADAGVHLPIGVAVDRERDGNPGAIRSRVQSLVGEPDANQ